MIDSKHVHDHPGLADLLSYPLMTALVERRTRRVACGVSLDAGALSHESSNDPFPLTPLEEAILVVTATGVTGLTMHDGPLTKPDGSPELGTPFLNIVARTGSSADNCQATSYFMINDDGMFLLKFPRGREAVELLKDLPPRWADWSEEDWLHAAERSKVRVGDRRMEAPRKWPYYLGWNAQHSNVPGSTIFFPVVDCTWQYINGLLIIAAEPPEKRMMFVDDWRRFHPNGLYEWAAKIGGKLGLTPDIPFHPIGGLKWLRKKFVTTESVGALGFGNTLRTDYGCFFYLQNLMLVSQAMGIGSWVHGSIFPPYVYQRDEANGIYGLGFRFQQPKTLKPMAPVPASQPNPIGIDQVFESLTPPYVANMDEAVDRVLEMKFGATSGGYGDQEVFPRSYREASQAKVFEENAERFSDDCIAYVKDICNYLYDTYGRFPAHVDAYYTPGIWLQFHHLELEYYDKFFQAGLYSKQAAHDGIWHNGDQGDGSR